MRKIYCIAITANGKHVVCGLDGGTLLCHDIATKGTPTEISLPRRDKEHIATIRAVADDTVLAAVRVKSTLR